MLFEPAHTRLAGAWDVDKAQNWLLRQLASGRLSLAGLVTHTIPPEGLGAAYEGLLKNKDGYKVTLTRPAAERLRDALDTTDEQALADRLKEMARAERAKDEESERAA